MNIFQKSLQTQLTVSFLTLIIFVTSVTFFFTVNEAKKSITDQMREELALTASIMASQVDGDLLNAIKSTEDTAGKEFMEVYENLNSLRGENADLIVYLYTMRIDESGDARFIVDADYLKDDGSGEIDVAANEFYEDAPVDEIKLGMTKALASNEPYTDEWGTFMSGYAPIKDSAGNVAGVLGLDFDIKTVQEKQDFLSSLIYYVIGFAIFMAALVILYFSGTIIKDLNKMTRVARELSEGNIDVELPEIKTKNEIYELNESLKSVFAAVEFLQDSLAELDSGSTSTKVEE
jgi:adenylate cyclase